MGNDESKLSRVSTETWKIKESIKSSYGFDRINVFSGPNFDYEVVDKLDRGTEFTVYDKRKEWITTNSGKSVLTTWLKTDSGWVSEISRMSGGEIAKYKRTNPSEYDLYKENKERYENEYVDVYCQSGRDFCNDKIKVKRKQIDQNEKYICYYCRSKYGYYS